MITKDPEVNARKHLQWLPEDWGAGRIKDFVVKTKNNDPAKRPEETFRYVDISSVSSSTYSNIDFQEMKGKDAPSRAKKEIRTNDVLYATVRPYLRRVAIVPIELNNQICSTGFCVLRSRPKKLDHNFLYNTLLTHWMTNRISRLQTGSNYPAVNDPDIFTQYLPLPPLSEQEKIAEILGCWDSGIEQLEKLIDAKQKMKKGLMQQLLTGKKRFKEFKGQKWKECQLGKLFKQITDKVPKKLTTLSITAGVGFVSQEEKFGKDISGKQYCNYIHVKTGDFCYNKGFSKTYNQGCVYKLQTYDEAAAPNAFISFRNNSKDVFDDFYEHWFSADYHAPQLKRYITSGARSDGLINLNKSDFFSIIVPLPPVKEQQKIASVLNAADREIELLCDKFEALKNQKKGLMQKLLTGKVRVNV